MSSALQGSAPTRRLALCAAVAGLCLTVACGGSSDGSIPSPDNGTGSSSGGSSSGGSSSGSSSSGSSSGGSGGIGDPTADDAGDPGSGDDAGTPTGPTADGGDDTSSGDAGTSTPSGLNPSVPPGGNFDLSIWQLQEPVGNPGAPTTFTPAQLKGSGGHQDKYFYTDTTDGSMVFWDPEDGVTTANSNYPRSELREMTASGAAANWLPPGTHTLSATVKATIIPDHVAVGQIHIGTGTPASVKPLLELYYYSTGKIAIGIETSPAGGDEPQTPLATVPLGTKWSYVIGLSGNTISITINGTAKTFAMDPSFDKEGMYFKAGNYDQSVGTDASVVAQVQFYALKVVHAP